MYFIKVHSYYNNTFDVYFFCSSRSDAFDKRQNAIRKFSNFEDMVIEYKNNIEKYREPSFLFIYDLTDYEKSVLINIWNQYKDLI
jgi:hypothetical protein